MPPLWPPVAWLPAMVESTMVALPSVHKPPPSPAELLLITLWSIDSWYLAEYQWSPPPCDAPLLPLRTTWDRVRLPSAVRPLLPFAPVIVIFEKDTWLPPPSESVTVKTGSVWGSAMSSGRMTTSPGEKPVPTKWIGSDN